MARKTTMLHPTTVSGRRTTDQDHEQDGTLWPLIDGDFDVAEQAIKDADAAFNKYFNKNKTVQ